MFGSSTLLSPWRLTSYLHPALNEAHSFFSCSYCVRWSQIVRVARNYELKQADGVCIVKNQCIVGMLEGTLHSLNVIRAATNVNLGVLRVLDRESVARALVLTLPASMALLKVLTALSDGQADILVVELCAVELKEVD